jgi:protein-export membrane protein SecD
VQAKKALEEAGKKSADFEALAKKYSREEATKDKGGDLGWLSPSGPYSHLYAVASTMKKGTLFGDTINAPEGLSVIKLTDERQTEKEVSASHLLICYQGAEGCESKISKEEARDQIDDLRAQATPQNFSDLVREHSTDSTTKPSGGDLGYFKKGMMVKEFEDVGFAISKGEISPVLETKFGFHILHKKDERPLKEYRVSRILFPLKKKEAYLPLREPWAETGLTGKQLEKSYVSTNQQTMFPEVGLEFDDEGKKLFGEITTRNVNKPLAIFLDGILMQAPRVNQAITDGTAVITGDFTLAEVKETVRRLNAGALPVPITLISQQTVGATLGEESLAKSLNAGLIGFLLVMAFMILVYRLPGVLAVGALFIYTALVLAVFKIWPVTLSLAGIAGFILSIGMAVDANVLIFERMKEELRSGKALDQSIRDGFTRAWTSIRDSNVSSLITCAILFWFSASLIKGFALTLAIGIVFSMFTAISVTRLALRIIAGWRIGKMHWLFGSRRAPSTLNPQR